LRAAQKRRGWCLKEKKEKKKSPSFCREGIGFRQHMCGGEKEGKGETGSRHVLDEGKRGGEGVPFAKKEIRRQP